MSAARRPTRRWAAGLILIALMSVITSCASRDPWQDARIESEVKARLVAEKSANLTRLGVVSRQAVVHLTGTVASPEQKTLAESVAKSVSGVRRVVNTLEVQSAPGGPRARLLVARYGLAARSSARFSSVVSRPTIARSTTSSTTPRHGASAAATASGDETAIAVSTGFTPMRAKFAA